MPVEGLQGGVKRFTCLTPIRLKVGDQERVWPAVHILPVTRRIERDWFDGLIQGPNGAYEALIDRLTYEPYYVIEEMQHPDVGLFNREFLSHLPESMSRALAEGHYPAPPVPPPNSPADGDEPDPPYRLPEDWRPTPPAPDSGFAAADSGWQGQEPTNPQAERQPGMDDANFELAQHGPDASLASIEHQARADAARGQQRSDDGKDLARELVAEPDQSPLAKAVQRSSAPPPRADGWQATPRDPFDPSRPPPPISRNRPPTNKRSPSAEDMPLSQALPGVPEQVAVDSATKREAIFQPKDGYVPDMSAAGYEEMPSLNRAFGISDM